MNNRRRNHRTGPWTLLAGIISLPLCGCEAAMMGTLMGANALVGKAMEKGIATQAPDQYKVRESKNASVPPKKGMTKSTIVGLYGEPNTKSASGDGETWTYIFKSDKKATFGQRLTGYAELVEQPKGCVIMFGSNGRVSNYSWN
jgi:hypothetical protein